MKTYTATCQFDPVCNMVNYENIIEVNSGWKFNPCQGISQVLRNRLRLNSKMAPTCDAQLPLLEMCDTKSDTQHSTQKVLHVQTCISGENQHQQCVSAPYCTKP